MGTAMNVFTIIFLSSILVFPSHGDENGSEFYEYSRFSVPTIKLSPYQWRYIRVELPPSFSSLKIALESDVNIHTESIQKNPRKVPMLCFRSGGPPLPDVSDDALNRLVISDFFNGSVGGVPYLKNVEQCYPLHKNMALILTYEQISPGIVYFGLFNGIGPIRTQSKMIIRGRAYQLAANVTVEACKTFWGQYCNQNIEEYSCTPSTPSKSLQNSQEANVKDRLMGSLVACSNSSQASCNGIMDPKLYSINVLETAERLIVKAKDIRFNPSLLTKNTANGSEISLMCYARYDVIVKKNLYDYSSNISNAPLVIQFPRAGTWYFTIEPVYQSKGFRGRQKMNKKICYSIEWQVHQCPQGKAGPNCTLEAYKLEEFPRKNPTTPTVYRPPLHNDLSLEAPNFPLEPLLSNSSYGNTVEVAWTYFIIDVPQGQGGKNIDIQLISGAKVDYQLYGRFGGFPSLDVWDFRYANQTSGSAGSMFKLYTSSEEHINIYIFYPREGSWIIGLRHPVPSSWQTTMSVSIKTCAYRCCQHGSCWLLQDANGKANTGYCSCDEVRGGFDCGVVLVSENALKLHSAFLVASNAAALLPAFWALKQKAFAEWVIFVCSGIASGIYHACDVGTWCALDFHVLQFMDFWLSFVAVVSTFVYLAFISEAAKRTIHAVAFIITALMAVTGPTRASNIVLVVGIGATGLLVGWLIEFCIAHKSISFPRESHFLQYHYPFCRSCRWKDIRILISKLMKKFYNRFQWGFMLLGLIGMSLAATCWSLEMSENYWFMHSLWHVTIYSAAFFFLHSKAAAITGTEFQVIADTRLVGSHQDSPP